MLVTREEHFRQREWRVQNPCGRIMPGVTRSSKLLRMAEAEKEEGRLVRCPWAGDIRPCRPE